MNRRSIIQALGLAPLTALASRPAAAVEHHGLAALQASWEKPRTFELQVLVPSLTRADFPVWNPGVEEGSFFSTLWEAVRSLTKTPDVTKPVAVAMFDKNDRQWGPTAEEYAAARFPPVGPRLGYVCPTIDVAHVFRAEGAFYLRHAVEMQARNIVEMSMRDDPSLPVTRGFRLSRMAEDGPFEQALSTLGSIRLAFDYYGPDPIHAPGDALSKLGGTLSSTYARA